jgi:hypothetical protein
MEALVAPVVAADVAEDEALAEVATISAAAVVAEEAEEEVVVVAAADGVVLPVDEGAGAAHSTDNSRISETGGPRSLP